MRSKSISQHVDIYFDIQKREFSLKHSNSKFWLCFRLFQCFRSALNVDYFGYMQLEILLRQELGKKYKSPTILPFLLSIGH